MKDLRDQVDAFRIWERTHNRENYGRYDAFKAGYDLGRNEALDEAAEVFGTSQLSASCKRVILALKDPCILAVEGKDD